MLFLQNLLALPVFLGRKAHSGPACSSDMKRWDEKYNKPSTDPASLP
jgi:hypothetical protein